ncbi:unnamed protein product, partial [Ixodes persulcatus]
MLGGKRQRGGGGNNFTDGEEAPLRSNQQPSLQALPRHHPGQQASACLPPFQGAPCQKGQKRTQPPHQHKEGCAQPQVNRLPAVLSFFILVCNVATCQVTLDRLPVVVISSFIVVCNAAACQVTVDRTFLS